MANENEVPANEAGIRARVGTPTIITWIQRGIVSGRYDANRPVSWGRWFVDAADLERAIAERALAARPQANVGAEILGAKIRHRAAVGA